PPTPTPSPYTTLFRSYVAPPLAARRAPCPRACAAWTEAEAASVQARAVWFSGKRNVRRVPSPAVLDSSTSPPCSSTILRVIVMRSEEHTSELQSRGHF